MTDMSQIKLVVSDLDGTLLNEDRKISPEAVEAVIQYQNRGGLFSFISGRPRYAMDSFARLVPVNAPLVSCNGALIYEGGHILECHSMKLLKLRPLLEEAIRRGMTVLYYSYPREYAITETEWVRERHKLGRVYPVRPISEEEWTDVKAEKVNIMNEGASSKMEELTPLMNKLAAEFEIVKYGALGCEISARGITKAAALRSLSRLLGIGLEEIMAVGDNENDNEMLRLAGVGAAVANAQEGTRACADYLCTRERSLGVAEAIQKFCL